jgi:hypothetical protein
MSTLPERMRSAAHTLTEVSLLYGYRWPDEQAWSPAELRHEAAVIEADIPQPPWDGNCAGHVYSEDKR